MSAAATKNAAASRAPPQGMMATLRGALVRLRPPDIEELGLA